MSLIFGINLCDRIYLSGDTRLTLREKDGSIKESKDRILKIVPFPPNIIGVFAGSADMSAFIVKRLAAIVNSTVSIRNLRETIKEILTPIVDEYWKDIDATARVVIIFGGINKGHRKKINRKDIYNKVMEYSSIEGHSNSMSLKPALFNFMVEKRYKEPPDSHVFSVQISPPSGFRVNDAEWGEFLAYGPKGITKETLTPKTFGDIEFSGEGETVYDNIAMTAILNEVVEKTGEETIGKTFVNIVITEDFIGVLKGQVSVIDLSTMQQQSYPEVSVQNGKIVSIDNDNQKNELVSLKDYSDFGGLEI